MGDSDDEEEVERDYRRNRHKYEAEGEEEADSGEADEVGAQEILDFDSDIAVLKARWFAERDEVRGLFILAYHTHLFTITFSPNRYVLTVLCVCFHRRVLLMLMRQSCLYGCSQCSDSYTGQYQC